MAITKEAEQAAFDAFEATMIADTISTSGLNYSIQVGGAYTSPNYLIGNGSGQTTMRLIRRGDPQQTINFPRIEWEATPSNERDTPAHARAEFTVRLHHLCNRNTPNGFSQQNSVVLRSRQVFHRASLTATGGWNFSTIIRRRGFQAPGTQTEQHYIVEYQVVMSAGTGGGF